VFGSAEYFSSGSDKAFRVRAEDVSFAVDVATEPAFSGTLRLCCGARMRRIESPVIRDYICLSMAYAPVVPREGFGQNHTLPSITVLV
jgi:hypothetical protein